MLPCSNYDSSCQNAKETLKRYYARYERVVCDHNEAYYAHGIVASAANQNRADGGASSASCELRCAAGATNAKAELRGTAAACAIFADAECGVRLDGERIASFNVASGAYAFDVRATS